MVEFREGVKKEMPTNSALEWFPRIEKAGLLVPKTRFVPYDHRAYCSEMEGGGGHDYKSLYKAVAAAALEIGYPVFIRTDLASAKHNGPKAYRASAANELGLVMSRTVEDNEMKLWLGTEQPKAFMVREWLELDAPFKAFGGHPIAREWRLFATRDTLLCAHFYWPEAAIKHYGEEPHGWKEKRATMERQGIPEHINGAAVAAASAQLGDEAWSVDFAATKTGDWMLIDMALAKSSYHTKDCKNKFGTERDDE